MNDTTKQQSADEGQSELIGIVIPFFILGVRDPHDNYDAVVCDEMADCVQICGMFDKDGEPLYFESAAYHLESWCRENGLQYKCDKSTYKIEV